jgi:chromate transporter
MVIARYFMRFHQKPLVQAVFSGLRPAVTGMIAVAAVQVLCISVLNTSTFQETGNLASLVNVKQAAFFIAALVLLAKTKLHPIVLVGLGAIFGIVFL